MRFFQLKAFLALLFHLNLQFLFLQPAYTSCGLRLREALYLTEWKAHSDRHTKIEHSTLNADDLVIAKKLLENETLLRQHLERDPAIVTLQNAAELRPVNFQHKDKEGHSIIRVTSLFEDWNPDTDILVGFRSPDAHAYLMVAGHRIEATGVANLGYAYNESTNIVHDGVFVRLRDTSTLSPQSLVNFLSSIRYNNPFHISHLTCIQKAMLLLLKGANLEFSGINDVPLSPTFTTRVFVANDVTNYAGQKLSREIIYTSSNFDPLSMFLRIYRRQHGEGTGRIQTLQKLLLNSPDTVALPLLRPSDLLLSLRAIARKEDALHALPQEFISLMKDKESTGLSREDIAETAQILSEFPLRWLIEESFQDRNIP